MRQTDRQTDRQTERQTERQTQINENKANAIYISLAVEVQIK